MLLRPRFCRLGRRHIALHSRSPASLEIEVLPYPPARPDLSVFEPWSGEYAAAASHSAPPSSPRSAADTLRSLVTRGDFRAAESLRREMVSHHMPIPHDALYLRPALHAIMRGRSGKPGKQRLDTFEAWLSLAPDIHEEWQQFEWQQFQDIRYRLFRSMDHLNLSLVYRFGLILASKGYFSGEAAIQTVSTLARYTQLSVLEKYLRELEDASQRYHYNTVAPPPSNWLADAYNSATSTLASAGRGKAALRLISMAHSRGFQISDVALNIAANHAPDPDAAIDQLRALFPAATIENKTNYIKCQTIPTDHTTDIATLAKRLRSLRSAIRSSSPPSPRALYSFIASYGELRRTRALTLLCSLAYRHSPKSAAAWAFAEMFHYRSQREPISLLMVFVRNFHPVGIPIKTVLWLTRRVQKEQVKRLVLPPPWMEQKLWPTAYHTALVWDATVLLSSAAEKEKLYTLLLSLARTSKRDETEPDARQVLDTNQAKLQLPPDTFDNAHFSPFVSWFSRRNPARARQVLQDMIDLGIQPTMVQWSLVARGYAQHDDPRVALAILDHLEDAARSRPQDERRRVSDFSFPPSWSALLGVHTNTLRGFVVAGDVAHAREVERRLVEHLGYRAGDRPRTDANIALLRALEDGESDREPWVVMRRYVCAR